MFEDFDKSQKPPEGRGRLVGSYLVSTGIIVGVAATLAATIATATVIVKKRRDVEVSFADLPPPPPPKPKVKPKKAPSGARKLAVRQKLAAPKEIPAEQPAESEGDLALAGDTGPVEGFVSGGADEGGGGEAAKPVVEAPPLPAPPAPDMPPEEQEVERITAPLFLSGCRTPEIPDEIITTAATIQIEVRMLIDATGRVADAKVIKSHPLIPDDLILRCARAQVFEPAHLPEGLAVPYPFRRRFTFKPSGA